VDLKETSQFLLPPWRDAVNDLQTSLDARLTALNKGLEASAKDREEEGAAYKRDVQRIEKSAAEALSLEQRKTAEALRLNSRDISGSIPDSVWVEALRSKMSPVVGASHEISFFVVEKEPEDLPRIKEAARQLDEIRRALGLSADSPLDAVWRGVTGLAARETAAVERALAAEATVEVYAQRFRPVGALEGLVGRSAAARRGPLALVSAAVWRRTAGPSECELPRPSGCV
jgi:hypothetical protein